MNLDYFFLPFLVKKSLEYLPVIMSLRGTLPSSSMISAMWSTPQWAAEKEEDKQHIDQSVSQSGPLWVCGWRVEGVRVRPTAHQSLPIKPTDV